MKKIIKSGVCLGLALAFLTFFNVQSNETKHVIGSAKLPYFENAEEVKNSSELIVEVSKISEEPVSYNLGDGLSDNLTLSSVKIHKVIKPMAGKELTKGDIIKIVESEWADEKNNVIRHTENYSKMHTGKKYTLYLGYNAEVDNYYPVGLLYGKVPVDSSENNFYGDFKGEHIKNVIKDLQKNP